MRLQEFKENDILVPNGYEGIYRRIGYETYQKRHDSLGGICSFPKSKYEELGNLSKDTLITYLDNSYRRLNDYVGEILNKGLQYFDILEDIVLGILEDTLFFASHINKTFLKNFLKNNAFLDNDWFQCLEFRNWRLGLLDHVTKIDEYDFKENVLENIMYLISNLKEYLTTKHKSNKINLFKD